MCRFSTRPHLLPRNLEIVSSYQAEKSLGMDEMAGNEYMVLNVLGILRCKFKLFIGPTSNKRGIGPEIRPSRSLYQIA